MYRDDTYHTIAQIWANKYLASRRRVPVPTGDIDVREANYVTEAEQTLLELARSACAKVARDASPDQSPAPPSTDEVRNMAAAILSVVLQADESQARVDRTALTLLQS